MNWLAFNIPSIAFIVSAGYAATTGHPTLAGWSLFFGFLTAVIPTNGSDAS